VAGSFFELGIAIEVLNHKFRFPNRKVTSFSADEAAAQTALSISDDLTELAAKGDTAQLGESSDTVDSGKSETGVVNSITAGPNILNVQSGIINIYDSADQIVVYGSKFPNNWTKNGTPDDGTIVPSGGGKNDRYAYFMQSAGTTEGLRNTFAINPFRESIFYRCGIHMKFTPGASGGTAQMELNDGASNIISAATLTTSLTSTFTRFTVGPASTASDLVGQTGAYVQLAVAGGSPEGADATFDDVFVESGEEGNNNGFFLFTEIPLRAGFDYDFMNPSRISTLSPNLRKKVNNFFGDKSEKMMFRCRFKNIAVADWDAIVNIWRFGENGNLINFHPFIDDLPGVMTGFLSIENMTKSELFDRTFRSFDFIFVEA